MRTRIISFFVVAIGALVMAPDLRGQKGALGKELTLKQSVDSIIMNSERNIRAAKVVPEKIKLLSKMESEIQKMRKSSPTQHTTDELYFKYFSGAVGSIPRKDFSKDNCSKYKTRILADYDPRAEDRSEVPAIQKALKILEALCE